LDGAEAAAAGKDEGRFRPGVISRHGERFPSHHPSADALAAPTPIAVAR
jgi:hypothetical protein